MAGIGFELRKLLGGGSFLAEMRAYLYAALVSSGPWLLSVICLGVLSLYRVSGVSDAQREVFRTAVIYAYAFSLVHSGFFQLVATRYLADKLYLNQPEATLSTFITTCVPMLGTGTVFGLLVLAPFPLSPAFKVLEVLLFNLICLIWVSMAFISSVKDYLGIVYAYAAGGLVSFGGAVLLGATHGLEGSMAGFACGQGLIVFWILSRLVTEFPSSRPWNREFLGYFKKYWDLALVGLLYNLAVWADKFVFWAAPDSRLIAAPFATHDLYEGPIFLSYLTIVPTLAVFLIKIETGFYEHYRDYYKKIVGRKRLGEILREKTLMVAMLRESMRQVFIVQGGVSGVCLLYAPDILKVMGLSPIQIPMFRVAVIASFLQVLMSLCVIVLFYFDLRRRVLVVTLSYLVGNAGFSLLSVHLGFPYYAYGYLCACLLALFVGFHLLDRSVRDLEFITFARQPVIS